VFGVPIAVRHSPPLLLLYPLVLMNLSSCYDGYNMLLYHIRVKVAYACKSRILKPFLHVVYITLIFSFEQIFEYQKFYLLIKYTHKSLPVT